MRTATKPINNIAAIHAAFAIAGAELQPGTSDPLTAADLKEIARKYGEAETRLAARVRKDFRKHQDDDVAWVARMLAANVVFPDFKGATARALKKVR